MVSQKSSRTGRPTNTPPRSSPTQRSAIRPISARIDYLANTGQFRFILSLPSGRQLFAQNDTLHSVLADMSKKVGGVGEAEAEANV